MPALTAEDVEEIRAELADLRHRVDLLVEHRELKRKARTEGLSDQERERFAAIRSEFRRRGAA